jgi:Do/DeqQ family serine protease
MKKVASLLFVAIVGGLIALGINKLTEKEEPRSVSELQQVQFTNSSTLAGAGQVDFVEVAKLATPTVVHIKNTSEPVTSNNQAPRGFDPFGFFDHPQMQMRPQQSTGSGVIISKDGYIVTNNHVVDKASKIEVTLNDKRTYVAEVIGTDPETDLALIKIEEEDLTFLPFGNSDNVEVGQWVIAVGNPFNLTSTVTGGIISAKGRNINLLRRNSEYAIENFIQTDAAVNPGNSGGALVSMEGQLIGINTAIASQTGSYAGYAFAVPVNIARKVIDDLLKYGEVKRAILGVRIQDVTSELAVEKGFKDIKGVYVPDVVEGGAADKAGIKAGDVILKVNEKEVNKSSTLQEEISKFHPGDEVEITVMREGKEKEFDVVLQSKEGKTKIELTETRETNTVMGLTLENLSREEKVERKTRSGVRVVDVDKGPFKEKGLEEGFIITKIDKQPVFTTQDVKRRLENAEGAVLIEGMTESGDKEALAIQIEN